MHTFLEPGITRWLFKAGRKDFYYDNTVKADCQLIDGFPYLAVTDGLRLHATKVKDVTPGVYFIWKDGNVLATDPNLIPVTHWSVLISHTYRPPVTYKRPKKDTNIDYYAIECDDYYRVWLESKHLWDAFSISSTGVFFVSMYPLPGVKIDFNQGDQFAILPQKSDWGYHSSEYKILERVL